MRPCSRYALLCSLLAFGLTSSSVPAAGPTVTPDVVYGHKDGLAMTFDVIQPEKSNGAGVIYMVSGGWFSRWSSPTNVVRPESSRRGAFGQLVGRGYTLFLVRHGSAPKYKVPDAVSDVRQAVNAIARDAKKFGVDSTRLGVFGGSAGGHLSLMLGTTADKLQVRPAAIVANFPPTDLRSIVGPSRRFPALDFDKTLADSVSPILHVTPDDSPTLLVHGDKDRLVPLRNSQRIKKAFEEHKVAHRLLVIEGASHGFRGEHQQQATKAMLEWFDTHLLKKPNPSPDAPSEKE